MTASHADLRAFEPLERLAKILAAVPATISGTLVDAQDEFTPRLQQLERAAEAADEDLRSAERQREALASRSSDEDEDQRDAVRVAERRLEEARRRLARIERAMAPVQRALSRYKAMARDLDAASSGTFPKAHQYLVEQLAAGRIYLGVQLGAQSAAGTSPVLATNSAQEIPLEQRPLPAGFFWLPIAAVADEDILRDPNEWGRKGITKEEMTRGVRQLYAELIPVLSADPGLPRDALDAMDRAAGRIDARGFVHPDSLAHLYDVFFGQSSVSAECYPDGKWHVNGRHRTSIARELGMTHIPARRQGESR